MIFEIYFKNVIEAEKAQLYQKLNNLITEYREGESWIRIELPDLGKSPEDTLKPLVENIWNGQDNLIFSFISPRMMTHVTTALSYPVRFTVWDTNKFKTIEL